MVVVPKVCLNSVIEKYYWSVFSDLHTYTLEVVILSIIPFFDKLFNKLKIYIRVLNSSMKFE